LSENIRATEEELVEGLAALEKERARWAVEHSELLRQREQARQDAGSGWTYRHIAACLGETRSLRSHPLESCESCTVLREWDDS